jgi:isoaspartyl peptidase/L-asparaginase-like protein (Ntn-hydrolase superfamily)
MADVVAVATWMFGQTAVRVATPLLMQGQPALDAALAGAQAVEEDPHCHSVGFAGLGDALGTVTLDACVMDGRTLSCGGVAAVQNVRHPAALARRVMEVTPHVLLVGEGAKLFAVQQGFPLHNMGTPESMAEWERGDARRRRPRARAEAAPPAADEQNHDTVTVLALDRSGSLGGVCTTSGLAYKLPGRVGDSPLIGHGLYVDNTAGAAGATGTGEEIIRVGGSLLVVEAMRSGRTPQEACEVAVRRINSVAVRRGVHPPQAAFLALDPQGRVGAASTFGYPFPYALSRNGQIEMREAQQIPVEPR